MEYGKSYKHTAVPVDIIEGKEGLIKLADFDEIIGITLSALLKGYKCSDEMIKRVVEESGIIQKYDLPVEFFSTNNPHTFAACITTSGKNIYLNKEINILEQNEIINLVESLPGTLKTPGAYQYLQRIDCKNHKIKVQKLTYEPPVFDVRVRYLSLSRLKREVGDSIKEEKLVMVLYIPDGL